MYAAKKPQLWSKLAAACFPGGVTDPELALVRVKITHLSFWDVEQSKLVQFFLRAKAAVTGRLPTEPGEHAQIRMNS